jgi:hypothetical protein
MSAQKAVTLSDFAELGLSTTEPISWNCCSNFPTVLRYAELYFLPYYRWQESSAACLWIQEEDLRFCNAKTSYFGLVYSLNCASLTL